MDRWYTPIEYFGIAGIDAIGGNINISNTNASGKILAIAVNANSNANGGTYGDKELKTSAFSAIHGGAINVQNFGSSCIVVGKKIKQLHRKAVV